MSREAKKHWYGGRVVFGLRVSLCGIRAAAFANAKKNVTCKNCKRVLLGYQGESK